MIDRQLRQDSWRRRGEAKLLVMGVDDGVDKLMRALQHMSPELSTVERGRHYDELDDLLISQLKSSYGPDFEASRDAPGELEMHINALHNALRCGIAGTSMVNLSPSAAEAVQFCIMQIPKDELDYRLRGYGVSID